MNTTWYRRDFLKTAGAATLSALAAGYPRALLADNEAEQKIKPSAETQRRLGLGQGQQLFSVAFAPCPGIEPQEQFRPHCDASRRIPVRVRLGQTELIRTPFLPRSSASERVRLTTAPLAAL